MAGFPFTLRYRFMKKLKEVDLNLKLAVFTDFDGTITQQDTLEILLDKYCTAPWRPIEDRVTAGELSENRALQMEFDLLEVELETALKEVETIPIDNTFAGLAQFCSSRNIPLTILSGGIDHIISRILQKHHLGQIPFFSNTATIRGKKWEVIPAASPRIRNQCNHCKTHHLVRQRQAGYHIVYIGDGNTDRCPAENADTIFAKGSLAEYLTSRGIDFHHFTSFADIQTVIQNILKQSTLEAAINE